MEKEMKSKEYKKLNRGFCDFCDYSWKVCNNKRNINRCTIYKEQVKKLKRKTTRNFLNKTIQEE